MRSYVTEQQLRQFAAKQSLQEQAAVRERASSRSPAGATFLSHSSKDDDLVGGAIIVIENHGGVVYIDKKDSSMPPYTNSETAKKLKVRIDQSSKFILLASTNSKSSKWVPWELGIADGKKDFERLAVFCAIGTGSNDNWTEWEYMGLYQQIIWGNIKGRDDPLWFVWNRDQNTGIPLRKWLQV